MKLKIPEKCPECNSRDIIFESGIEIKRMYKDKKKTSEHIFKLPNIFRCGNPSCYKVIISYFSKPRRKRNKSTS